jgi:hypothetical protein
MSTQTTVDGLPYYHLSMSINHGNSGGPVFDARGRVVAVVVAKAEGGGKEGLGLGIPLPELQEALAKVERQSPGDAAKAVSKHDLAVVARRLAILGVVHSNALESYVSTMNAEIGKGANANQAWLAARKAFNEANKFDLDAFHEEGMSAIRAAIPRVLADAQIPEQARTALGALASTYTAMRSVIDNPRTPMNVSTRTRELVPEFKDNLEKLRVFLGDDAFKE